MLGSRQFGTRPYRYDNHIYAVGRNASSTLDYVRELSNQHVKVQEVEGPRCEEVLF